MALDKFHLTLLVGITLLSSCDKIKTRKYAGTYECSKHSYWWMMGEGSSDTTYIVDFVVERDDYEIILPNGSRIHADDLRNEQMHEIGSKPDFYQSIQFIKDSIYYNYYSGGLGGGSGADYAGVKKK
jgi:hypothetical protein